MAGRRKYDTVEEYQERAKTRVRSDRGPDNGSVPDSDQKRRGEVETKNVYSDQEAMLRCVQRSEYLVSLGDSEMQYIDNWMKGDDHGTGSEQWAARDRWVRHRTDEWKILTVNAAPMLTPLHQ